jgi:hypothetical protein
MIKLIISIGIVQSLLLSNEAITPANNNMQEITQSLKYKENLMKIYNELDLTTFRSSLRPMLRGTQKRYLKELFDIKELNIKKNNLTIETEDWYYAFIIKNIQDDIMTVYFSDDAKYATYIAGSELKISLQQMKVMSDTIKYRK